MKILHIIPSFTLGGAEHVVVNYLLDWSIYPDEIMALSLYGKTDSINDKIIEENNLNVTYANCEYNNKLQIIKAIKRVVSAFKPDVIHSHMRVLPFVYIATFSSKIRIVHTIHTEPEVNSAGKILYFDKFCFRQKRVQPICLNIEMAQRANSLYGITKTEYLYNGIRLAQYTGISDDEKRLLKQSLGIKDSETVICHVGRFVKIKNQRLVVEVFAQYLKKHPESKLLLVGDGPELENIKKSAEEKGIAKQVVFAGARSDVPKLLQISDKYIFPSIVEGLGISVIEAQAAGLPCVISNIIPKEAVVSDCVTRINLEAPIEDWVLALEGNKPKEEFSSIDKYDIKYINSRLRSIYKNEY